MKKRKRKWQELHSGLNDTATIQLIDFRNWLPVLVELDEWGKPHGMIRNGAMIVFHDESAYALFKMTWDNE